MSFPIFHNRNNQKVKVSPDFVSAIQQHGTNTFIHLCSGEAIAVNEAFEAVDAAIFGQADAWTEEQASVMEVDRPDYELGVDLRYWDIPGFSYDGYPE